MMQLVTDIDLLNPNGFKFGGVHKRDHFRVSAHIATY